MINGHGDDAYKYKGIKSDFSSNICPHGSHQQLMTYLASIPDLAEHYPEPEAFSLERMIAERHGISPEQVIVTSGATEAIYLIAQTFGMHPVIPQPTFSEYRDACEMFPRIPAPEQMLWLCNPNNPTGEVYDQSYIDRMMEEYDLVVIDQSYENYTAAPLAFINKSAILAPSHPRTPVPPIIQIHSMTKTYAIPGLRLGYITAHESLTSQIRRNLRPWSVSSFAIEAGKYLLQHDELLCKPDLREAQRLAKELDQIWGVVVTPTQTNFMLCRLVHHTAAELKEYLATKHGMLIRDASNFEGLTPHHFRVAAQSAEENDALVAAVKQFMEGQV